VYGVEFLVSQWGVSYRFHICAAARQKYDSMLSLTTEFSHNHNNQYLPPRSKVEICAKHYRKDDDRWRIRQPQAGRKEGESRKRLMQIEVLPHERT